MNLAKLVDVGTERSPQKMWFIHRSAIARRLQPGDARSPVQGWPQADSAEKPSGVRTLAQKFVEALDRVSSSSAKGDLRPHIREQIINRPRETNHEGKHAAETLLLMALWKESEERLRPGQ
jgi:hypothetical protein